MTPEDLHKMVSVELDLDDISVPLSKQRALGLQAELYIRFSNPSFQSKLDDLKAQHGRDSAEFRKLRQQLVMREDREVLPKYGYQATPEGVKRMFDDVQKFSDDPMVQSNTQVINHLIGATGDDAEAWLAAHQADVSQLDDLSRDIAPPATIPTPTPEPADIWNVPPSPAPTMEATMATAPPGPGVELDMSDVTVPLTKDRVLRLQNELLDGFSASDFQAKLRELEAHHKTADAEFRRGRVELALEVQAKVLPKYGFKGNWEGVADMVEKFEKDFADDPDVAGNMEAADRLLRREHSPETERGTSTSQWLGRRRRRPLQLDDVDDEDRTRPQRERSSSGEASTKASTGRRGTPRTHVTAKDGYWEVVGGQKSGGLRVRLGEDTTSILCRDRLKPGAVVKQVMKVNERMNYEKVSGDGPNYGWVSIHLRGMDLLKPFTGEVPFFRK